MRCQWYHLGFMKRWTILAILVALAGALCASLRLLTEFERYDDEGYMLVSLAHYIKDGHLYTQTFSQYGPFYFYAQGIFFQLLGLPVTHDMGRLVTLVYWVASSLLAAVFVYRVSKSAVLASAAGLCGMLGLRFVTGESGHPQQVVLLLLMAAACLSLPSVSGRMDLRLFLLGCVGAALAFTKINVGVFYIAGLAQALVCLLPSGRLRSIGLVLTLSYAAAVPWLLMHGSFGAGYRGYCFLATVTGIATFVCGARIRSHDGLPVRAALCAAAGLFTGATAIVIATSLQGVSVASLIFGVILNPLHQADVYSLLLDMGRPSLLAATLLTAGVFGLTLSGRILAAPRWLDALRCAAGFSAVLLLVLGFQIQWVAPLLPLSLMPRTRGDRGAADLFPRLFITSAAVVGFLVPYPVAGSQKGIAAAPMILWAFLCIADGVAGLRESSWRPFRRPLKGWALEAVIGGAILLVCAGFSLASSLHDQFPPSPTSLKGSEWLHLPVQETAEFEAIAGSVSANCDVLFTMPGMGSFNIWSGVPTPTGWNMTGWMTGIGAARQAEILSVIKADPRACAILDRRLARFWTHGLVDFAKLPLASYVMKDMPKIAQVGEYEIRVHPGRNLP